MVAVDSPWTSGLTVVVGTLFLVVGCTSWHDGQAPWHLNEEPSGSVLEVRAEFGGSSCTRFKEWQVHESPSSVEIAAVIEESNAEVCTNDLVYEEATIELDAPLGDRTLTGCRAGGDGDCRAVDVRP